MTSEQAELVEQLRAQLGAERTLRYAAVAELFQAMEANARATASARAAFASLAEQLAEFNARAERATAELAAVLERVLSPAQRAEVTAVCATWRDTLRSMPLRVPALPAEPSQN